MWPKREKSGAVSSPVRVVAPMSVNGCTGIWIDGRERAVAGHDVDAEVLHRRIEALLDDRVQPVDLVDEEDVVLARAS